MDHNLPCLTVKQRMKSVQNIQKITKAMKMVAASKMRLAQTATEQSRGMVAPFVKLLGDMPGALWEWITRFVATNASSGVDVKNNVTVPITSDKGLCGGINTTITKYTRATDAILNGVWFCIALFCSNKSYVRRRWREAAFNLHRR